MRRLGGSAMLLMVPAAAMLCFLPNHAWGRGSRKPPSQVHPSDRALAARHEFFYHLKPETTLAMVLAAVGRPDSRRGNRLAYRMRHGTVVLTFDVHGIVSANHLNPGDGTEVFLYRRWGRWPGAADLDRRERLLSERKFTALDKEWGDESHGAFIVTYCIKGHTFIIRGGYVTIEPLCMLAGAKGSLANRIAKVTVCRSGTPKVIYRAWDEWQSLRPPRLTEVALDQRISTLRKLGHAMERSAAIKSLGEPDAEMGSGFLYFLYWMPDGLVTIRDSARGPLGACEVTLEQPGAEKQVRFEDWLVGARPSDAH